MNNTEKSFEHLLKVEDARSLFPITEKCIYLDSAHYVPYSLETKKRLNNFIEEFTFTNKCLTSFNFEKSDIVKSKCAKLINSEREDIILTYNTSHGLNILSNGIKLQPESNVAFADSEFPSIVYCWMNQVKLRNLSISKIPSKLGKISLEDIENTIKKNNTKVLTISSVSFLGFRNNLESIGYICKENDCLLVVDGIQSVGVCPVDVKKMNIDFLSVGCQKWLMTPSGMGFAYISKDIRDYVDPTFIGVMSINFSFENFLDYKLDFRNDGGAYEVSTLNCLGMIGLETAIDLYLHLGIENIFSHIIGLQKKFINCLEKTNYEIISDISDDNISNILIFSHKNKSLNSEIQKKLAEKNIFIALREGYLRISPHIFNNDKDIVYLSEELKKY